MCKYSLFFFFGQNVSTLLPCGLIWKIAGRLRVDALMAFEILN